MHKYICIKIYITVVNEHCLVDTITVPPHHHGVVIVDKINVSLMYMVTSLLTLFPNYNVSFLSFT